MNKNKKFSVNIGFSSILMVFIMICLVTFASLSLLTANSDYRLSQKMADKTTAYYTADTAAREASYEIEKYLTSLYLTSESHSDFYESIDEAQLKKELSEKIIHLSDSYHETFPVISFEIPVSTVQVLYVSLEIHYPEKDDDNFFSITKWSTKTLNSSPEEDTHLNLLGG